jgi:hypothetical protein
VPPGDTIDAQIDVLRQRHEADTESRRNNLEDRLVVARHELTVPADLVVVNGIDGVMAAARRIAEFI